MTQSFPLTLSRAEAYREACADRGAIAFVAVLPPEDEKIDGFHAALGIAIANERGYTPVPMGWARFTSWDAAEANANQLNKHLGLDALEEMRIVASTMGGRRYTAPPATVSVVLGQMTVAMDMGLSPVEARMLIDTSNGEA
jgi:hypothetical protein